MVVTARRNVLLAGVRAPPRITAGRAPHDLVAVAEGRSSQRWRGATGCFAAAWIESRIRCVESEMQQCRRRTGRRR